MLSNISTTTTTTTFENFSLTITEKTTSKLKNILIDKKKGGHIHLDYRQNKTLDQMHLSVGSVRLRESPNAGGTSEVSEMLSYEVITRLFGDAELLKTETEVVYFPSGGAMTDYVCKACDKTIGVSVTRAMAYGNTIFTADDATNLLIKKLKGVNQSSRNSLENWYKQILFVWSESKDITNTLVKAYNSRDLPDEIKSNTVTLFCTTHSGEAGCIYTERRRRRMT